jgi:hypothetical protein
MRRVAIPALFCLLCAGIASQSAEAQKRAPARDLSTAPPYWFHYPQFTDAEVRLVVNWFEDALETRRLRITPMPATVAREIHISAKLTANILKSLSAPPAELEAKLLPLPDGYRRMLAGSVLVIIKTGEELVVDTLPVGGK